MRTPAAGVAVVVATLALAACSSSGGNRASSTGVPTSGAGQPSASPSLSWPPSAATYGPSTVVAGTYTYTYTEGKTVQDADGYSSHTRDGTLTENFDGNDPRTSGTAKGTLQTDRWGAGSTGSMVQWGTTRLTNSGGSWVGTWSGIYTSDFGDVLVRWWRGEGGYRGLTFYMLIIQAPVGPDSGTGHWQGLIYPGDPPPQ